LSVDGKSKRPWHNIYETDKMYHKLAIYEDKSKLQSGREVSLKNISPAHTLMDGIKPFKVPPATMTIPLRGDMNYDGVPRIERFKSRMTIASGISAPKILTAIGTDGLPYKQLVSSKPQYTPIPIPYMYLSNHSSKLEMMIFGKTQLWSKSSSKSASY
jgi:ataxia telangiectasia mutated family protein